MMFGWLSAEAALASWTKRRLRSGSLILAAMARAATSIAGLSRKLPASCREASSDRTSRSSASSPAHACRKNSARSSGGRSNAARRSLSTCFQCSESIACPAGQFAIEPRFGGAPITHHRDRRYLEHLRRLFHAETAKYTTAPDLLKLLLVA